MARCEAAHKDDLRPCHGRPDDVVVVDAAGARARGCVRHATALLASLDGARVLPGSLPGAATEVHRLAQRRRPFDFRPDGDALERLTEAARELREAANRRDEVIRELVAQGESVTLLARLAGLTPARVYQIRDRRR